MGGTSCCRSCCCRCRCGPEYSTILPGGLVAAIASLQWGPPSSPSSLSLSLSLSLSSLSPLCFSQQGRAVPVLNSGTSAVPCTVLSPCSVLHFRVVSVSPCTSLHRSHLVRSLSANQLDAERKLAREWHQGGNKK